MKELTKKMAYITIQPLVVEPENNSLSEINS